MIILGNLRQNHASIVREIENEKIRNSIGEQNRFSTIKPFKIFQSYHISPESQIELEDAMEYQRKVEDLNKLR